MPLAVCATPIGNLEDVTLRVLAELRERGCRPLRGHAPHARPPRRHGIGAALLTYHRHNEAARVAELMPRLVAGERIALVSDAGPPGVNDPGSRLVAAAIAAGVAGDGAPRAVRGRDRARRQRARRRAVPVRRVLPAARGRARGALGASSRPGRIRPSRSIAEAPSGDAREPRRCRAGPPGRGLPRADEAARGGRQRHRGRARERFAEPPRGEVTLVIGPVRRARPTRTAAVAPWSSSSPPERRAAPRPTSSRGSPAFRASALRRSLFSLTSDNVRLAGVSAIDDVRPPRYVPSSVARRENRRWIVRRLRRSRVGGARGAHLVAPQASAWSWPVDGAVLRPFSLGADPYAAGSIAGSTLPGPTAGRSRPGGGHRHVRGCVPASGRTVTILTATGTPSPSPTSGRSVAKGEVDRGGRCGRDRRPERRRRVAEAVRPPRRPGRGGSRRLRRSARLLPPGQLAPPPPAAASRRRADAGARSLPVTQSTPPRRPRR